MFKSLRFLSKNTLTLVLGLNGFVLVCCGIATATNSLESIFGTYAQSGGIMAMLTCLLLPITGMNLLMNLALSMGARRKGMWAAMEICLVFGAAVSMVTILASQTAVETIAGGSFIMLNLKQMELLGIVTFAAVLLSIGNISLFLSMFRHLAVQIIGWAVVTINIIAVLMLVLLDVAPIYTNIAVGVAIVLGAAAAVGSYLQIKTIAVKGI